MYFFSCKYPSIGHLSHTVHIMCSKEFSPVSYEPCHGRAMQLVGDAEGHLHWLTTVDHSGSQSILMPALESCSAGLQEGLPQTFSLDLEAGERGQVPQHIAIALFYTKLFQVWNVCLTCTSSFIITGVRNLKLDGNGWLKMHDYKTVVSFKKVKIHCHYALDFSLVSLRELNLVENLLSAPPFLISGHFLWR